MGHLLKGNQVNILEPERGYSGPFGPVVTQLNLEMSAVCLSMYDLLLSPGILEFFKE